MENLMKSEDIEPMDAEKIDSWIRIEPLPKRTTGVSALDSNMTIPGKFKLHQLYSEDVPMNILDRTVKECLPELMKIRACLAYDQGSKDAESWLQSIEDLIHYNMTSPTIIGLIGNTGAGKSSVINAIIGQKVLATSTSRACTAVVTEIAYNHSNNYSRAEVEFISRETWEKQCEIAISEARDSELNQIETSSALAKLKAVYPKLRKHDYKTISVDDLMNHPNVAQLGSTIAFCESNVDSFYRKLRLFVDSPEKSTDNALWPLIQVVRVYVKANALSTGVRLVDLPGVRDSNAGRASVADSYMSKCSGIWIVTPIVRAADDQTAASMMDKSMQRQMRMDGHLSVVSIVCSKTDDISVEEMLDCNSEIRDELSDLDSHRSLVLSTLDAHKTSLKQLEAEKNELQTCYDNIEADLDSWTEIQSKLTNGIPKLTDLIVNSTNNTIDRFRWSPHPDTWRSQVTPGLVGEFLDTLKGLKTTIKKTKKEIHERLKHIQDDFVDKSEEIKTIEYEKAAKCISKRNESSISQLRSNFRSCLDDYDEDAVEASDAQTGTRVEKINDELVKSMKIFAVSARAYQQLSGLTQDDDELKGFREAKDTGIPELEQFCQSITHITRRKKCVHYLTLYSVLLNNLSAWAISRTGIKHMTREEAGLAKQALSDILSCGQKDVLHSVDEMSDKLRSAVKTYLSNALESAKRAASTKLPPIVDSWSAKQPKMLDQIGVDRVWYSSATFRGICSRNGIWKDGRSKNYDWINEIASPMQQKMAPVWNKVCIRQTDENLKEWLLSARRIYSTIHQHIAEYSLNSLSADLLELLKEQNHLRATSLSEIVFETKDIFSPQLKLAHRIIERHIQQAMAPAFAACVSVTGRNRMAHFRKIMADHVEKVKRSVPGDEGSGRGGMFHKAAKEVEAEVGLVIDRLQASMQEQAAAHFDLLMRDYMGALDPRAGLSETTRQRMAAVLKEISGSFHTISQPNARVRKEEDSVAEETIPGEPLFTTPGHDDNNSATSPLEGEVLGAAEIPEVNEKQEAVDEGPTVGHERHGMDAPDIIISSPSHSMASVKRVYSSLGDFEDEKDVKRLKQEG